MNYEELEKIKTQLEDKEGVSLVMLQDLKRHVEKLIEDWGSNGDTFRIM